MNTRRETTWYGVWCRERRILSVEPVQMMSLMVCIEIWFLFKMSLLLNKGGIKCWIVTWKGHLEQLESGSYSQGVEESSRSSATRATKPTPLLDLPLQVEAKPIALSAPLPSWLELPWRVCRSFSPSSKRRRSGSVRKEPSSPSVAARSKYWSGAPSQWTH